MGGFLIHLTTCLTFVLFILLDEMDMKSSALGTTRTQRVDGQSQSQLTNHQNHHHPLHPDWKFTYHRVYPGNKSSTASATSGTKRKSTGIAAMSITAIGKGKGKMSLRATATTSTTATLSPSIRKHEWSSILEQELMQSLSAGRQRGEEFHWRPWISEMDLDNRNRGSERQHQRHLTRHSHRRRHWKRHHHENEHTHAQMQEDEREHLHRHSGAGTDVQSYMDHLQNIG